MYAIRSYYVDVSDPADPQNIAFITIPGNVDIAIKENVLYADSYISYNFV